MNFGTSEPPALSLSRDTFEQNTKQLKEAAKLNDSYQAALNMDLLTFENRLKQYASLASTIDKTINQLTRRRKTHFNASFIVEHVAFPDSATPFLIPKRCPKYFSVLKKMRVTAKQLQLKDKSGYSKKIGMQPDLSENKYKFSVEEDEQLRALVAADKGAHDWIGIGKELSRPTIECVRRHLELTGGVKKSKWTPEENKLLKEVVQIHGTNNWLQISNYFEGKTSTQCFHHWMKKLNPNISRGKWLADEDIRLATAYRVYSSSLKSRCKQWNKIAAHISGRTDVQCRERYCNILDPSLKNGEWNSEEDERLGRLVQEVGVKWAEVAKRLGNRTDNQCWRRWKRLKKKTGTHARKRGGEKKAVPPVFRIERAPEAQQEEEKK